MAVNAAPGSTPEGRKGPRMRRCALDEIGRNSVRPCTRPSSAASSQPMDEFMLCLLSKASGSLADCPIRECRAVYVSSFCLAISASAFYGTHQKGKGAEFLLHCGLRCSSPVFAWKPRAEAVLTEFQGGGIVCGKWR